MPSKENNPIIGALVFIVYILALLVMVFPSPLIPFRSLTVAIIGLLISILGIVFWLFGFLTLKKSFSLSPKAKELVRHGIYEHLRHPIYNGIVLTFFGLSLARGSLYGILYSIFIVYPLLKYRSHLEEKALLKKFGKKYQKYLDNTSSLT